MQHMQNRNMAENEPEKKVIHYPATKTSVLLPNKVLANIIALIPYGELITSEAINDMWAQRKGVDFCEPGDDLLPYDKTFLFQDLGIGRIDFITSLPKEKPDRRVIPYWRIVSKTGFLQDYGHYSSKESQRKMLEQEGHIIVQQGKNSFRVENYKDKLFDLERLLIPENL